MKYLLQVAILYRFDCMYPEQQAAVRPSVLVTVKL